MKQRQSPHMANMRVRRLFYQPHGLLAISWRVCLLVFCLGFALRMSLAEIAYRNGMVSPPTMMREIAAAEKRGDHSAALALYFAMVQQSLDDLKAAGEWYPYDYWFRTAQANQLYVLSADIPDLTVSAETAIGYALAVDSTHPELVAGLLVLQRRLGKCDEARATLARLVRLAPHSPKVQQLAAQDSPCGRRP